MLEVMQPMRRLSLAVLLLLALVPAATSAGGPTVTVEIYAPRGNPGVSCTRVFPLPRTVAKPSILAGAMQALLAGPTAKERRLGYEGWFSRRTAHYLRSVRVRSGVASIDFRNFSRVIPNASASCGSALLLAQLNRTALQFRTVKRAVYSFNGSTRAFYEWLQLEPPSAKADAPGLPTLSLAKSTVDRAARTVDIRLRICFSAGPRAAISVSERRALHGVQQAASHWIVPRAIEPTRISPYSCRTGWRVNWLLKPRLAGPGTYTAAIRVRDAYGRSTPPVALSVTSP